MKQPTNTFGDSNRTVSAPALVPDVTRTADTPAVEMGRVSDSTATARPSSASTHERGRTPTPLDAPTVSGFVVQGQIGRGGMGQVFAAFDPHLQQDVALKVMDGRSPSAELRRRFEQEARILSTLHHRNVIPVRSGGHTADGRPFYTMKLVTTGTLLDAATSLRSDVRQAVRLLVSVARAVQYLHAHQIWHRDLKPTNVLMDDEGQPLVADFGVAKFGNEDRTLGSPRVGTYAYMAPEMIADGSRTSGPAADVWSLGVIAYELLGGRRPFVTDDPDADLTRLIRTTEPLPLVGQPDAVAAVDAALEAVVRRCLAKRPADRCTAGEFADALDCWLAGQPIPELKPRRRGRWRWAVAAVTVLAAIGITLAGVPRWLRKPATLAERLERGEVVTVVGPNGELLGPLTTTDPEMAQPVAESGGGLVMNSTNTTLAEIWSEPLPHPVKLTAEVEMLNGPDRSEVGVYGLRRRHQASPLIGRIELLVSNGFDGSPFPRKNAELPVGPATFAGHLFYADNPTSHWVPIWPCTRSITLPEKAGEFRTLSLTIRPEQVSATNGETEFGDQEFDLIRQEAGGWLKMMKVSPSEPVFGSGFGIYVHRASGRFRNVTVERLVP